MLTATIQLRSAGVGARPEPTSRCKVQVTPSLWDYPRSHAANHSCPEPTTSEKDVLESLKYEWERLEEDKPAPETSGLGRRNVIADLLDFEIYRCPLKDQKRSSELTSLHLFDVKAKNLSFDGYVRLGQVEHYVERIQIQDLSIEGYGSREDPDIVAYIQTRLASIETTHDIWLQLKQPASRYKRFHAPFMWVATLGKHAIDYMDDQKKNTVGLESFKNDFHCWLIQRFGSNKKFTEWFAAFGNVRDFRVALNAYVDFFYNQVVNLSTSKHLISHPVWSHCKCNRTMAIERQPDVVKDTLATPHVFESFKHVYFASKLKPASPSKAVKEMQHLRKQMLGFAEDRTAQTSSEHTVTEFTSDSGARSGSEWLAYVQGIEYLRNGAQRLLVLWLYRPSDTNMCLAKYPIANEVFLSDNCNCGEREILTTDVSRTHSVDWNPKSLNTGKDLIIRQTYITQDSAFVTVTTDHTMCPCRKPKARFMDWRAGDTVYITEYTNGQQRLEPVVIYKIDYNAGEMKARVLLRLARDCLGLALEARRTRVAPNELVLTDKLKVLPITRIKRACRIRFVQRHDVLSHQVPSPYDQRGAGDHWFISMGLHFEDDVWRLNFLEALPAGFHEAREAPLPCKKLRGLSLFSGGGGLDRGLEEGGAVEFQTSVDYDPAAIHTQRANCHDPQNMRLFCGSVDDYLQKLLSAIQSNDVACVGKVDLIAAGSPCPGFSALQQNMLSQQSLTHASHVTTFCTAVDVYRPLYGILENVINMASTRTGFEDQNVLSQLVACMVSMGYQVNQFIMDSWSYGSCQRRSRIVLTIAAPGLQQILQPPHTHSRSYEETVARSLGRLPNGERFGDREYYPTPFPHVSAAELTSDLPNIGNGNVQTCVLFPDHRLSRPTNGKDRALLEFIPRQPPGYGYAEAMQLELVPPLLQMRKKEMGRAYRRIKADGLIPTITTDLNMQDARNGASVHWSQHRPLSIQEVRRTQGYPDHEPIIGSLNEQWRIIGNGVDRKVSFSLGLTLRDTLTKSKCITEPANGLENETELFVDVDQVLKYRLTEAARPSNVNTLQETSVSSSAPVSTDSFSSTCETKPRFNVSTLLDKVNNESSQASLRLTSLQRFIEVKEQVAPTSFRRSSLSALSTSMQSARQYPSIKRQREDWAEKQEEGPKLADKTAGSFKRAKFGRLQRSGT
ncbi:DNA (cytosine-5-)-methyltransferase [Ascochyta rabiei]|uniref:DNA (cytosine-5-)-methyltransferase n=1 Tax=Didymella rabiei TaxID=5454 RepID=UPI00220E8328|nr:DNA (cytosine-5-)-methyltransferase [Ascochyta rabiei]UPX09806.1 DNA (cytosine-5-)-methyltransferase [Ascochyta rabiei]